MAGGVLPAPEVAHAAPCPPTPSASPSPSASRSPGPIAGWIGDVTEGIGDLLGLNGKKSPSPSVSPTQPDDCGDSPPPDEPGSPGGEEPDAGKPGGGKPGGGKPGTGQLLGIPITLTPESPIPPDGIPIALPYIALQNPSMELLLATCRTLTGPDLVDVV
ncbi:hypothetical protein [Catenuloplanes indicus]|uniref:Uncharacterized protein n=1 Tax=Catenuloplanes indicus TaxID=137267 RepID=A0AAE4AYR3_9ACTN|nr:hypothetical protein [Catenuloplanes indicus]MDQ0367594.1 hypothetical protein [Catenuloplanes indicus]